MIHWGDAPDIADRENEPPHADDEVRAGRVLDFLVALYAFADEFGWDDVVKVVRVASLEHERKA